MTGAWGRTRGGAHLLVALLSTAAAFATSHASPVALTDGVVHTVSGPVIDRATVVFEDDRILAVGAEVSIPAGAEVIDLDGAHVYPGLINMSTLLGLYELRDVRSTRDDTELGTLNPNIRADVALNPSSELLPVARAGGILSFLIFPQSGRVNGTAALAYTDGWTPAQMTVRAPVAMVVNWPSTRLNPGAKDSMDKQRRARRDALRVFDDAMANARAYARAREVGGPVATGSDVKWEAMTPVVRGELPILARCGDLTQIRSALEWAERHDVRLVVNAQRDAGRIASTLAERGVSVILDGAHMRLPRGGESYDTVYRDAAVLHEAGVTFALGTGTSPYGTYNARQLSDVAALMTRFGLPPEAAVRAMTLSGAEICGVADRLGSIEPGKEATLIVADGDILEVRTAVLRAWIRGTETDLRSRHVQLYEKYRARPPASSTREP